MDVRNYLQTMVCHVSFIRYIVIIELRTKWSFCFRLYVLSPCLCLRACAVSYAFMFVAFFNNLCVYLQPSRRDNVPWVTSVQGVIRASIFETFILFAFGGGGGGIISQFAGSLWIPQFIFPALRGYNRAQLGTSNIDSHHRMNSNVCCRRSQIAYIKYTKLRITQNYGANRRNWDWYWNSLS